MNTTLVAIAFDHPDIFVPLDAMSGASLDELDFGVIGFDVDGLVRAYNRYESEAAGLSIGRVAGKHLFTEVAPCMNNFMVAQRFEDAQASDIALDATIDYVLTLRMRPTRVQLRLVAARNAKLAYVLVNRRSTK